MDGMVVVPEATHACPRRCDHNLRCAGSALLAAIIVHCVLAILIGALAACLLTILAVYTYFTLGVQATALQYGTVWTL